MFINLCLFTCFFLAVHVEDVFDVQGIILFCTKSTKPKPVAQVAWIVTQKAVVVS